AAQPQKDRHLPQDDVVDKPPPSKLETVAFADFPGRSNFITTPVKDTKRQPPKVLSPSESNVEVVPVQLPALVFDYVNRGGQSVPTHVKMVEAPAGTGTGMGGEKGGMPGMFSTGAIKG